MKVKRLSDGKVEEISYFDKKDGMHTELVTTSKNGIVFFYEMQYDDDGCLRFVNDVSNEYEIISDTRSREEMEEALKEIEEDIEVHKNKGKEVKGRIALEKYRFKTGFLRGQKLLCEWFLKENEESE